MILLVVIVLLFLYTTLIYTWIHKMFSVFVGAVLVMLCMYDWLFIELSYHLSSAFVFIFKTYQELIVLALILLLLYKVISHRILLLSEIDRFFWGFIAFPFLYLVIVTLFNFTTLDLFIKGVRCFYLPIFFAYFLYKKNILILNLKYIRYILLLVVLFAAYQFFTYSGDLSQLWFYQSYSDAGENPIDTARFNFEKDGLLRATSFFVTSIDLSVLSALLSLLFVSRLFFKCSIIDFVFFIIAVTGIYFSQTRMGWFVLIIGLFNLFFVKMNRGIICKSLVLMLPIGSVMLTFVSLIAGGINDLSAVGRIVQFAEFGLSFLPWGAGLSDYQAIFSYDSFFLAAFRMMGICGIFYFLFYVKLLFQVIDTYNSKEYSHEQDLYLFVIISSSALIYAFTFHHIAGSVILAYIFMFLFSVLPSSYCSKKVKIVF